MFSTTAPARYAAIVLITLSASPLLAGSTHILFDLPSTVAAMTAGSDQGTDVVRCQFRVSSLIASPGSPQIDQWLVICQPRDAELIIHDYSPKTDAQSDVSGAIEVKKTDESSSAIGLSIDGNYIVRGNIGADAGNKTINSRQYAVTAPKRAVTASGTINRGRGVYFKFRRSANQILEGDKTIELVLRVPPYWRGSLIDVSIIAQSQRSSLAGLDKQIETMGQSNFVVAAYREGDQEAAQTSRRLADAEQSLREMADQRKTKRSVTSLSGMLRRVAIKLDLESPEKNNRWVRRLLTGDADPYLDKDIKRLPMDLRLAVLDYCEVRDEFDRLAVPRGADTPGVHTAGADITDRVATQEIETR